MPSENFRTIPIDRSTFYKDHKTMSVINHFGLCNESTWVAGGAVRSIFENSTPKDYDVFFKDPATYSKLDEHLANHPDTKEVFRCRQNEMVTYASSDPKAKIQLISRFNYNGPFDLIASFDFTVTMFATDGEYIYCYQPGIFDVYDKDLNLYLLTYPNATMKRAARYIRKGYRLTNAFIHEYNTELIHAEPDAFGLEFYPVD